MFAIYRPLVSRTVKKNSIPKGIQLLYYLCRVHIPCRILNYVISFWRMMILIIELTVLKMTSMSLTLVAYLTNIRCKIRYLMEYLTLNTLNVFRQVLLQMFSLPIGSLVLYYVDSNILRCVSKIIMLVPIYQGA